MTAEATQTKNQQAVKGLMDAMGASDRVRFGEFLSDNVRWRYMCDDKRHGDISTKQDILEAIGAGQSLTKSGIFVETKKIFGDGDTFYVECVSRGELKNGNIYDNPICFVFEVRDGKICEVREYMDTAHTFRVFGE